MDPLAGAHPFARGVSPADGGDEDRDLVLERTLFFSDAVFAIAMTLLVIELRPPDLTGVDPDGALAAQLTAEFGQILGVVISFLVIGLYWEGHLRIFRAVRRMDRGLVGLNLVFLFWIAFMPFPTAILGGHDPTRGTVAFYAAVQVGTGLTQVALWWYVTRHRELVRPAIDARLARYVRLQLLRGPVIFGASIVLTLVSPWLGIATWALLVPASLLIDRRVAR